MTTAADITRVEVPPWLACWTDSEFSQPGSGPGLLGVLADGVVTAAGLPDTDRPQVLADVCAGLAGVLATVMAKYTPEGGDAHGQPRARR